METKTFENNIGQGMQKWGREIANRSPFALTSLNTKNKNKKAFCIISSAMQASLATTSLLSIGMLD